MRKLNYSLVCCGVLLLLATQCGAQQTYQPVPAGAPGNPIPTPMATPAPVVVQPGQPVVVPPPGVVVPNGVVYVAPTYPAPAVGFIWSYHPVYGWGWFHPHRGWHRGWR
jgi:hypothetical protein